MAEDLSEFKRELSVRWVKGKSGTTYLCPTVAFERLSNPSEDDLRKICVDESMNPQND